MSHKKPSRRAGTEFKAAFRHVRGTQEEARSRWFPNEAFEETEEWARDAVRLAMSLDFLTVDPVESRGFIDAVRSKSVGSSDAPAPDTFYTWCSSLDFLASCKAAIARGNTSRALVDLVLAGTLAGIAEDRHIEPGSRRGIVEMARKAANVRHAPARERKARLLAWYSENSTKYRSMDAAAEVAARNFGVAFRTAREYIGEYRKHERSARKT